jgi:hypothetical protein
LAGVRLSSSQPFALIQLRASGKPLRPPARHAFTKVRAQRIAASRSSRVSSAKAASAAARRYGTGSNGHAAEKRSHASAALAASDGCESIMLASSTLFQEALNLSIALFRQTYFLNVCSWSGSPKFHRDANFFLQTDWTLSLTGDEPPARA